VRRRNRPSGRPDRKRHSTTGSESRPSDFPLGVAVAAVVIALVAGFVLRVIDLKADPPASLSWSSAVYSDEAHNAYSARNSTLYGRTQVDDYVPYLVYPWLNLFTDLVFRVVGIGFVQLKIVSLLAGLLLILAMYFLGRPVSRRAGAIAAVVTGFCFPLVMYSRIGLAEMTQVLLVAATIAFLARAETSRAAAVLSGVCALFAVLFVKVSAGFLPVAALLLLVFELIRARHRHVRPRVIANQALLWLLGAAIPFAVWLAVIFIPHRATYLAYVFEHSVGAAGGHPRSVLEYLLNAFSVGSFTKLYDHFPFAAALGFAVLPAFAGRAGRTAVFSALVLVSGVAMLGYGYYHPTRYELFSLVPLIAGFAFAIDRLLEKDVRIGHPWPRFAGALFYGLWLWPLAAQVTFRLAGKRAGTNSAVIVALVIGLVASFLLWGLHRITRGGVPLRARLLRFGLAGALVLLALGHDVKLYTSWYGSRTHAMYDASCDLDRTLPDSSVTGGFWAPALLSTSHKRAVFISTQWGANITDPIARFGLTHLVIANPEEFGALDSITGGRVSQANVVRVYELSYPFVVAVVKLEP